MKVLRTLCVLGVALALVAVAAPDPDVGAGPAVRVPPTIEIAEKEQRSCVTCHTALGRPELNEAGQYYRAEGTLEGYPGELPPRDGEPEPGPREPAPEPEP